MSRTTGRRAVLRWAVRLARREWRQQLLVLTMLTVSIGAAIAASAMAVNAVTDSAGQFGTAQAIIRLDGPDATSTARIDAARQRFGVVDVIIHGTVPIPGSVTRLDERDQDPNGPYGRPMLALRAGRYPSAAGEVALTATAATLLDATIGSDVVLDRHPAHVVGMVENPSDLRDTFALVAPGQVTAPDHGIVLVDITDSGNAISNGSRPSASFALEGRSDSRHAVATLVLVVAGLALALVGLLATAGFAVLAQRRQRQLGMLAAIGAPEGHIGLVMLANGAIVGLVAVVLGAALGIIAWFVSVPALESATHHRIDRLHLPFTMIAIIGASGIVAATLAAWRPAHLAARVPIITAVSGRPIPPRSVHRSLLLATFLVGAGAVAIGFARTSTDRPKPLLLIGGLLGCSVGTVLLAPAAIRILGRAAGRLPFAARLTLRDLARYQARASAALAAITLSCGIGVAVIVVASVNRAAADEGNLSSRELIVHVADQRSGLDPGLTPAAIAALDQRAAAVVAALGTGDTAVALDVAFAQGGSNDSGLHEPVSLGVAHGPNSIEFFADPYVATPELLALYGIDPAVAAHAGGDFLSASAEPFIVFDGQHRPDLATRGTVATRASLPLYRSAPRALVTEQAMQAHGWRSTRAGWIVESKRPLTRAAIAAARRVAAEQGLEIEARDSQDSLSTVRNTAALIGGLLAVAIVAMALGLIRSEASRDMQTLTAVGASRRTRRALTACTAAGLAIPGALLGVAGAYVALAAAYHADLGRLLPIPTAQLIALLAGTPAAATIIGWLMAGLEPRSFARRTLD